MFPAVKVANFLYRLLVYNQYTTVAPQIKVNHGDIYQIYPVVMATSRDLIYHGAMATGYILLS